MGRVARLLHRPSLTSLIGGGDPSSSSWRNTFFFRSSVNLAQQFANFRRRKSLEKFLDRELYRIEIGAGDGEDLVPEGDCQQTVGEDEGDYYYKGKEGEEGEELDENFNWMNLAMAGLEEMPIWDLSSAKLLQTLEFSKGDINSVDFSRGRNFMLATGSGDKNVEIYKWKKGEGFTRADYSPLKEHKYTVTSVQFSPGTLLASASVDGTCILWDATNGEKITSFTQPGNSAVRVCQFSPRSTLLLTAGDCGAVHVWDISTRTLKKVFKNHEESVYAASFLPVEHDTDVYLASACSGGLLNLWDAGESDVNKPLTTYESAHDLGVTCMAFASSILSGDKGGKLCLMVTGGHDQNLKLWNVTLRGPKSKIHPLRVLQGHSESVMCVRISNKGLILSSGGDKTLRMWELSGKCVKVLEGHSRFVTSCCFSEDSRLLASGSNDKSVKIWDLSGTVEISDELQSSQGIEYNLTSGEMWSQYEKLCRSRMMHQENGVILKAEYEVPKIDFNSCVLVGTKFVVAAASSNKCIYAWNIETGEEVDIASICSHKYAVNSVCVTQNPGDLVFASASTDGTINLFNTERKLGGIYHPSGGALRVCKFSACGSLLIAGSDDGKASLWKMKTTSLIKQFEEHESAIFGAAFTPDITGYIFAITGSSDGCLKLWDCSNDDRKASIATQEAHELGVTSCDFSPIALGGTHGQHRFLLATGGNDAIIKIWYVDVKIAKRMTAKFTVCHTLTDHNICIYSVSFSPGTGKILASASGDKTCRLFDVGTGKCLQVIEGHERYVTSCSFGGGSLLATCSSDHHVKIWQLLGSLAYETATIETGAVETVISKWTCEEVVNWLAEIGLGDLGHVFEAQEISGEKLATLTENVLQTDLGIDDNGLRAKILTEIKWLKSLGVNSSKTRMSKSMTIAAPIEFFCPITHDIMIEPVTTCDGHTYERTAITEWFLTGKTTSPLTNMELESMTLTPNFELQNRISEFLAQRLNAE